MTYQPAAIADNQTTLPELPSWVTSRRAESLEDVAFRSGVALTVLDALVAVPAHGAPVRLLANLLALKSAAATSKLEGRLAREADIRDAFRLTPPGEARGPDGDLLAFWREAVLVRLAGRDWQAGLKNVVGQDFAEGVEGWIAFENVRARTHGPLSACVSVMRAVLEADSRAERVACVLSDAVLARLLNWKVALPITSQRLSKPVLRDLVADRQGADLAVQAAILGSVEDTVRLARDLAVRAAALRAVAPKLRAKGSEAAVAVFLSEDAVAPGSMLSPLIQDTSISMTDRAARRFCDRLVALGVVRELTGRSTFRLYGIAP